MTPEPRTVLSAIRWEQWYKNLVIFIGIVFSLNATDLGMLARTVAAFGVFCVLSSGIYLTNDIHDAETDRLHPSKRERAVASGEIHRRQAMFLAIVMILTSLGAALLLGIAFASVCVIYTLQSLLYTFWLKHVAVVDIVVVSVGFVWRAIAGTVVIGVRTSPWLIICSFLLALFLALLKRESEMTAVGASAEYRSTLGEYSNSSIEVFLTVTTASLLVAYMLYTFESEHIWMMVTIPFAFIGVFRSLQLVREGGNGDTPTLVFRDRIVQIDVALWGLASVVALYDLPDQVVRLLI